MHNILGYVIITYNRRINLTYESKFTNKQLNTYGNILTSISFAACLYSGVMINSAYHDFKEAKNKLNTEQKKDTVSIDQKPLSKVQYHLTP